MRTSVFRTFSCSGGFYSTVQELQVSDGTRIGIGPSFCLSRAQDALRTDPFCSRKAQKEKVDPSVSAAELSPHKLSRTSSVSVFPLRSVAVVHRGFNPLMTGCQPSSASVCGPCNKPAPPCFCTLRNVKRCGGSSLSASRSLPPST